MLHKKTQDIPAFAGMSCSTHVSLLYCFLFYFHVHFICLSCCTKFYCDRCFSFLQAFDRSFWGYFHYFFIGVGVFYRTGIKKLTIPGSVVKIDVIDKSIKLSKPSYLKKFKRDSGAIYYEARATIKASGSLISFNALHSKNA